MKTMAVLFLSLTFSTQAFCIHNYFQETCSFETSKGEISLYKRNYWEGRHMMITSDLPDLDHYEEVYLPGDEAKDDDSIKGDEVMVFNTLNDSDIVTQDYDDGCWQGFNKTFVRHVKVESAAKKVKEILNISPGDELTMKCGYEHLVILGDACDKL